MLSLAACSVLAYLIYPLFDFMVGMPMLWFSQEASSLIAFHIDLLQGTFPAHTFLVALSLSQFCVPPPLRYLESHVFHMSHTHLISLPPIFFKPLSRKCWSIKSVAVTEFIIASLRHKVYLVWWIKKENKQGNCCGVDWNKRVNHKVKHASLLF